jgi:hypothetical protein
MLIVRTSFFSICLALGLAVAGCNKGGTPANLDMATTDDGFPPDVDLAGGGTDDGGTASLTVSGQVITFEDEMPVAGTVTLSTTGLIPAPMVSVTGATFSLTQVLPNVVFAILASSKPTYRDTYNVAPQVDSTDVVGVKAYVVAESTLSAFASAFSVTPNASKAIVLAHFVNSAGAGVSGIPTAALQLNGAASTAHFLDGTKMAAAAAATSSASGWAVFYDVDPGLAQVTTPMASGWTLTGPQAPTAAGIVTVVQVTAAMGTAVTPTNISFMNDVMPIFTKRGCVACHSGNGPGKDLGGLQLNGGPAKVFTELTVEVSPNFGVTRVNTAMPAKSLVLTMPSAETPPDPHPTVVFPSSSDPDYIKILQWIKEGAKNN